MILLSSPLPKLPFEEKKEEEEVTGVIIFIYLKGAYGVTQTNEGFM